MVLSPIEYCHHAKERDDFVGICFEYKEDIQAYVPKITFPYGYHVDSHDDILTLITVLSHCQYEIDDIGVNHMDSNISSGFPIQSYMTIIQHYLNHGYYHEHDVNYASSASGKVNWRRTIAKEKPIIQNNGAIYLKMQVKRYQVNDEYLITEISRHCVYESFMKMGWYYRLPLLPKPTSFMNLDLFISIVQDRLHKTNKDSEKHLFQSMLHVLKNTNEQTNNPQNFRFGTQRFEKVWEYLVDKTFGTEYGDNKKQYFPKSFWHIDNKSPTSTNELYPDTIMINHKIGKLYVIDSKYYRYGATNNIRHLPSMSSIAKQVVYAKYIDNHKGIKYFKNDIYNIFILPFDKLNTKNNIQDDYVCIGYVDSNLFDENIQYTKIYTVLVDAKHLIKNHNIRNLVEINRLSRVIECFIGGYLD